jgi:hypothetical protein
MSSTSQCHEHNASKVVPFLQIAYSCRLYHTVDRVVDDSDDDDDDDT